MALETMKKDRTKSGRPPHRAQKTGIMIFLFNQTPERQIMIQATTYIPAAVMGGEITEQIEYICERVNARSLLTAVEALERCGRLSYVPEIQINGASFTPRDLHEIACCIYDHRNGARSVRACSDILAHVASRL